MSTAIAKPLTFEERMKERIRESIGDLMTDEDLKKIVEAGVKDALFTARRVDDHYGRHISTSPGLIHEIVKELLRDRMNKAVEEWIAANPEEIQKTIKETVQAGIGAAMIASIDRQFNGALAVFASEVERQYQRKQ